MLLFARAWGMGYYSLWFSQGRQDVKGEHDKQQSFDSSDESDGLKQSADYRADQICP